MPDTALDQSLERASDLLQQLAERSEAVVAALSGADSQAIRSTVRAMQETFAGLRRLEERIGTAATPETRALLDGQVVERLQALAALLRDPGTAPPVREILGRQIKVLISAAQQWERVGAAEVAYLEWALGTNKLSDMILTPRFDPTFDTVVLVGEMIGVARELQSCGVARIAIVGSDELPGSGDTFLRASTPDALRELLQHLPGIPSDHAVIHKADDSTIDMAAVQHAVQAGLQSARVNLNAVASLGPIWTQQVLANTDRLGTHPSVAALDNAFSGKPAVIVAPGPSLAKNVNVLAQLAPRMVVLVASRALRAVQAAGVRADFTLVVDPQPLNFHFKDIAPDVIGAKVLAASVDPSMWDLPGTPTFSCAASEGVDGWIYDAVGEDATVRSGGSVTTVALSLALRMGCNPILFVGQDLAFTDGQVYAANAADGTARMEIDSADPTKFTVRENLEWFDARPARYTRVEPPKEALYRVPRWDRAGELPTSFQLLMIRQWYEDELKHMREGTELVNCTEGGAYIAGMEHVALAEAGRRLGAAFEKRNVIVGRGAVQEGRPAAFRSRRDALRATLVELADCSRKCAKLAPVVLRQRQRVAELQALDKRYRELVHQVPFLTALRSEDFRQAALDLGSARTDGERISASVKMYELAHDAAKAIRKLLPVD